MRRSKSLSMNIQFGVLGVVLTFSISGTIGRGPKLSCFKIKVQSVLFINIIMYNNTLCVRWITLVGN